MNKNMIQLSTQCNPLFIILQVLRWGVQLLTPLSKYPSLYTHLQQVAPVLELRVICYNKKYLQIYFYFSYCHKENVLRITLSLELFTGLESFSHKLGTYFMC